MGDGWLSAGEIGGRVWRHDQPRVSREVADDGANCVVFEKAGEKRAILYYVVGRGMIDVYFPIDEPGFSLNRVGGDDKQRQETLSAVVDMVHLVPGLGKMDMRHIKFYPDHKEGHGHEPDRSQFHWCFEAISARPEPKLGGLGVGVERQKRPRC